MTRRMRIDDLTALAVPSQPALSPDGSASSTCCAPSTTRSDRNVDQLWTVAAAAVRRGG